MEMIKDARAINFSTHLSRFVSVCSTLLRFIRKLVDVLGVVLFCYMVVAIFAQIMGRYVFNYSIAWAGESATLTQVWLVLLGAGIAMRHRQHVGIDILVNLCPPSVQRVTKAASFLLVIWFLAVVIVGSFSLIAIGMVVKSAALGVPMAIPYAAIPVGVTYFMLEFAIVTLPEILRPGESQRNGLGDLE